MRFLIPTIEKRCVGLLLAACVLVSAPSVFAVAQKPKDTARGALEIDEQNPWFSYYILDKVSAQNPEIAKGFKYSEADSVKRIDQTIFYAYPKMRDVRPGGVIAQEDDKNMARVYRRMAYYAANDQVVSAQIVFVSAQRLVVGDRRSNVVGLPFLTVNQFITHVLCEDEPDDEGGQPGGKPVGPDGCAMVADASGRAKAELKRERLQQYLGWSALGLAFHDRLAYESGLFLMEAEHPTADEARIIRSILNPLVKRDAGKTIR